MKAQFRTLAVVATLIIFGAANTNAAAKYSNVINNENMVEIETSLTVEDWMIDEDLWTPKTEIETVENERPLQIESWMTNENLWK